MRIWQKLKCSDERNIFFFFTENLKLTSLIEAGLPNCYIKLLDKTKVGRDSMYTRGQAQSSHVFLTT